MHLIARAALYARHYHYQDKAQWPDEDSLLMAAMEHPCWKEFDALWQLYQSLPFTCGPGWRYLAYRNRKNYIRLKKPSLTITGAIARPLNVHNVFLLARADWRSASAGIDRGAFDIATEDGNLDAQLRQILMPSDAWVHQGAYHLQASGLDPWSFCQALQIIQSTWSADDLQTDVHDHVQAIRQSAQVSWGPFSQHEKASPESWQQMPAEDKRLAINIDAIDEATKRRDSWI